MSTTQTSRTIPKVDFSGASSNPTPLIFQREISDLALSVQPLSVRSALTNIEIEWSSLPTAADLTLIDDIVTSHAGGIVTGNAVTRFSLGEDSENEGTETEKLSIDDVNFAAGDYVVIWSAEVSEADVKVYVDDVQEATSTNDSTAFENRSGSFAVTASNSQVLDISLRFNQTNGPGPPPGNGLIRRARLIVIRLGS